MTSLLCVHSKTVGRYYELSDLKVSVVTVIQINYNLDWLFIFWFLKTYLVFLPIFDQYFGTIDVSTSVII